VSPIEIITLIAMVLVAGGVSSRLVEAIKSARWSGRAKMQVVVKRLLRNRGPPPDKQEHATQLVLAQAEVVCEGGWRDVCE
jgi:type I restriction enzyme, R subunit